MENRMSNGIFTIMEITIYSKGAATYRLLIKKTEILPSYRYTKQGEPLFTHACKFVAYIYPGKILLPGLYMAIYIRKYFSQVALFQNYYR